MYCGKAFVIQLEKFRAQALFITCKGNNSRSGQFFENLTSARQKLY